MTLIENPYSPDQEKETCELGKAIDSYMRFRAEQEGQTYTLTPEFFEKKILAGIRKFFGVTFTDCKLIGDEQQPTLFKQWNRKD
jgi:hypothetical protein